MSHEPKKSREGYMSVHKTFLVDLCIHGLTLGALVNACREARFDFSDSIRKNSGKKAADSELDAVYQRLQVFLREVIEYSARKITHKDLASRAFDRAANRDDALNVVNQLKAITGLFCDSEEERASCLRDVMDRQPDEEEDSNE